MTSSLDEPDLAISLHLDAFAPRAARHHVGLVDRPSPDLRDAVMLLTSELVTRAVQHQGDQTAGDEEVELRVWMPGDVVRVELRGACDVLSSRPTGAHGGADYERLLLENVADRWSLDDTDEQDACVWFEIDRHETSERLPARV